MRPAKAHKGGVCGHTARSGRSRPRRKAFETVEMSWRRARYGELGGLAAEMAITGSGLAARAVLPGHYLRAFFPARGPAAPPPSASVSGRAASRRLAPSRSRPAPLVVRTTKKGLLYSCGRQRQKQTKGFISSCVGVFVSGQEGRGGTGRGGASALASARPRSARRRSGSTGWTPRAGPRLQRQPCRPRRPRALRR